MKLTEEQLDLIGKEDDEYLKLLGTIRHDYPPMLRVEREMRYWLQHKANLYHIVGKKEFTEVFENELRKRGQTTQL